MKKIQLSLTLLIAFWMAGNAENPMVLTSIHNVYGSLDEVRFVLEKGQIDGRIVQFLLDETHPTDQKAAIMNALTDNNKTRSNALTFKQYIARKHGENWEQLNLANLSGIELFCLGYLTILDANGDIKSGLPMLEQATVKEPGDFTILMIFSLASAQKALQEKNPCLAWKTMEEAANSGSLSKNMDAAMETILLDAAAPYKASCD